MLRRFSSRLSLRAKVIGISLIITGLALAFSAATSIVQMRYQIDTEQHHTADSVALGMARSGELAMTSGDSKELSRLANSFLRDPDLLFIAAYRNDSPSPVVAIRNRLAWDQYIAGRLDPSSCIVAEHQIETTDKTAGRAPDAKSGPAHPRDKAAGSGSVGRIVVGLSTTPTRKAQWRQSCVTVAATILAAAVGGMFLFLALGSWLRRLQNLAHASQSIARGDFTNSINDRYDDEIGRLAHSFEGMRLALLERELELRSFTETLQDQVEQRTHDLREALLLAEEANRAKSLFLANMSHELRTPLNGVIGMVDLLHATATTPQQQRYSDLAKVSARSLLELINDVLDFSKIEAGKLELETADFDLYETVEASTQMLGERAQKKNLELICGIDPRVPRWVNGDAMRFGQVLMNLISNAVKFTERGEVVVNVALHEEQESQAVIKVEVRDTGCGIPRDRLDRLFKSFSQVDTSTTRKFGGTGLGLAISQRIAEMMGGQMGVESEEGKGSTFWFTACLRKRVSTPSTDPASVDLRGMRVLVVDDNNVNREILHVQLAGWLLRPDEACGAQQAIEMLQRAAEAGDAYRVAILDMHMPGADAGQFARQIKSDPRTRAVILIGLSPIGDPVKEQELNRFGFAACLNKPVLPSSLYDTIVRTVASEARGDRCPPIAEQESANSLPLTGLKVLLAEDNEINEMVAVEILSRSGGAVTVVRNGLEAVEAAMRGGFDVVLMDCQMPKMDGLEATRLIRKHESESNRTVHVPIIALTANAIKGDRELCLAAGMDGYVSKPIEAAEVVATIQSVARPGRPRAAVPAAQDSASPTSPDNSAPIDFGSLRRRCMGNRRLAAKALETFAGAIGKYVEDLAQNLRQGDAKSAAAVAHKIKGAAGNVSAPQVLRIAAQLEEMSKGDAVSQTEPVLAELQVEIERVRQFVSTSLQDLIQT
ncbi:MAG TPA: response regulator [Tepidisphaeraceae bacterium]|jgi:signal transduction histidine kinase/CheY-like chemotaxis protein|nr:response regulator [Tepidisphaeraceae bacterium]